MLSQIDVGGTNSEYLFSLPTSPATVNYKGAKRNVTVAATPVSSINLIKSETKIP